MGHLASYPKKGVKIGAKLGFWDECGIAERPTVRRSWAPKGKTPIVRTTGSWHTRSVIGIIICTPKGKRPNLYLGIRKTTIRSPEVIRSIKILRGHVKGKLILLWDGLRAHQSKATRAFLKTQRQWLRVRRFPPYAPELNPVEYLWSSGKRRELGNFCPKTPQVLDRKIRNVAQNARRNPDRLKGFLKASSLFH